jgi:hypothetical protein
VCVIGVSSNDLNIPRQKKLRFTVLHAFKGRDVMKYFCDNIYELLGENFGQDLS